MPQQLFDEDFLKKLEYLYLVSRKIFAGERRLERRSKKIGSGIEFADYRNYSPGDDFRTIDWKAYGRFERLFLRLYEEEEDLSIHFLLDASPSMYVGSPPKVEPALKIVAALAYVGLCNLDRVNIHVCSSEIHHSLRQAKRRGEIFNIFRLLQSVQPGGLTRLERVAAQFLSQNRKRGLVIWISDFYDYQGYEAAVKQIRYHHFECFLIHLVSPEELEPSVTGDISLLDSETQKRRDLTLTPSILARYQKLFRAHCDQLESFCYANEVGYLRGNSTSPFEDLVLKAFRKGLLVQ